MAPSNLCPSLVVNPHSRVTLGWRSHFPSCPVGWDELDTRPLTAPPFRGRPFLSCSARQAVGGRGAAAWDPTSHRCWERIA